MINAYCRALGIDPPSIEAVRRRPEANTYALLIIALLEKGGPMTLEGVAARFERAGVAPSDAALLSLKRCRPARPPVYRDGDLYSLDPHDDETDLWVFRLGLHPPPVQRVEKERPAPPPMRTPNEPLSVAELEEAWSDGISYSWSAQRLALAALDTHGGEMRARPPFSASNNPPAGLCMN